MAILLQMSDSFSRFKNYFNFQDSFSQTVKTRKKTPEACCNKTGTMVQIARALPGGIPAKVDSRCLFQLAAAASASAAKGSPLQHSYSYCRCPISWSSFIHEDFSCFKKMEEKRKKKASCTAKIRGKFYLLQQKQMGLLMSWWNWQSLALLFLCGT